MLNEIERDLCTWVLITYGENEFDTNEFSKNSPFAGGGDYSNPLFKGRRVLGGLAEEGYFSHRTTSQKSIYRILPKAIKELQDDQKNN
jgi:hypothetical protein